MNGHIRHGVGSVRPYVHGPISLVAFVTSVFGAEELERHEFGPDSVHLEMKVGDSVLVLEAGDLPSDISGWTNTIYVYVPDVDATFARAVTLGAEVISKPADKPYQERQAGFRDSAGNTWWVATFRSK